MSLDSLRDALVQERLFEIAQCEGSRKRKLRQLFKVTAALRANRPQQLEPWDYTTPPGEDEAIFLDENDQAKGLRFNDATLPFPPVDIQRTAASSTTTSNSKGNDESISVTSPPSQVTGASKVEEQLRVSSTSPSTASQTLPTVETSEESDVIHVTRPSSTTSRGEPMSHLAAAPTEEKVASKPSSDGRNSIQNERSDSPAALKAEPTADDRPTLDPSAVASPMPEDGVSSEISDQKAPQTVHLPTQEIQEARLRDTEEKLDKAAEKEQREDEKLAIKPTNGPTDLVSSPSSTVGGYSQATPHAPHHSPDTSPDTESFHDDNQSLQADDILDPAAQQVKEDHERALQKQMREAREQAREIRSSTPEIEKQLEDEQAIRLARDGKSRLSESDGGHNVRFLGNVESSVRSRTSTNNHFVETGPSQDLAADSLPTPTTTAPEPSTADMDVADGTVPKKEETDSHPTPPADTDVDMDDVQTSNNSINTANQQSQDERMNAKDTPGTIQPKSVSEIVAQKAEPRSVLTPRSSNPSASISPPRVKARRSKSNEVSTVVFAKKTMGKGSKALQMYNEDYASLQGASEDSSRDYLEGLFKYQAHHPPRSVPLQELVASARKTVSTAGTLAMIREHQDYKILKRVYQLQNANRWSLRQLQKSVEPERQFTHVDQLLLEMKWMQTDFREERNWKKALAATFADWCAEYVNSSSEQRAVLRVKAHIPPVTKRESNTDEDMTDAPTPDLVHSHAHETESESFPDEDELPTPRNINPPTGIFSLGFNDVVMKFHRTPASDTMFRELPFYEPILEGASDGSPFSVAEPPILPVSKYVTGKLVSQIKGPPRKRSRYDYDSEDEPSTPPSRSGTSAEHSMPSTPGRRLFCRNDLPPEMTDVALFNSENKHVRDRLQAAHQFRPPTEFNMPTVQFFEHRIPSQWLWEEDQKLRALVKEYTFNWSLVSQQLSLPSLFVSGSGRRTPWECFERWVQLEGLPAEMSKTQYFRTYQGRLETANKTVFAQYQAQQQQQQQQGQASSQPRRRPTTTPIRVERRRENRHLAIIDGMRKLARKRESAAHKQAESQKAAALRKAHEPAPPKSNVHTPQEFSRLKWEREEKLKLRQQQQEMAVRQQLAAQRQAQMQAAQGGMPNGANQMPRNGTPGGNPGLPAQMANSASQQGQNVAAMAARAHQGQQGMQANFANGNMPGMPMGTPGVPQAQMQGNMQNAQRMAPPDQMRAMAMQRGQFPNNNQQHQFQLQQQQMNMANNMTQGMGMNNMPNANMMASMSNQNLTGNMNGGMNGNMNGNMNANMNGNMNGNMNAAMNGMSNNASSPRVNQVSGNMQTPTRPLSSGHMPGIIQLSNSLKVQHPEWSQEQVQKVASEQLSRFLAKQQRVQAMTAAAGASGMSPSPQMGNHQYLQQNGGMANNPPTPNAVQNYQQQLVQQQRNMIQQRQQANSPGMSARPPSRSATPQNQQMQQSPGMQQAQVNRS